MRILALTPYLSWPPEHGGRIRSFHLLRELARAHRVINVTGLAAGESEEQVAKLQAAGLEVRGSELEPRFGRLSASERALKLWNLCRGRSSLVARYESADLARTWRQELGRGADLIVLDHVWMADYLPPRLPAPLLFSTHNVESAVLARRAGQARSAPARALGRLETHRLAGIERALLGRSRLCVATSGEDREAFLHLDPRSRVEVVANGVDVAACPPLPAPRFDPPRLLYVGGYDYPPNAEAGLRLAQEILPRVRRVHPAAELHLVGRDPCGALDPVRGLPGVFPHGHVESLVEHYQAASVVVVPLTQGGGSRLKILEAWAVGRPVVATAIGAQGLAATPGTHFLQAEDAEQTVAALRTLAEQPELCRRMIADCRRRVAELHDWPVLARRFRELAEAAAR